MASDEPGRKRVSSMDDEAKIRWLLRSKQLSISEVARVVGIARNTVKAALVSARLLRISASSVVNAVESRIRELLTTYSSRPLNGSQNGLVQRRGTMRSSWRHVCSAKSPPVSPTAVRERFRLPSFHCVSHSRNRPRLRPQIRHHRFT